MSTQKLNSISKEICLLKAAMGAVDISQSDIYDALGINKATLSKGFSGKSTFNKDTYLRIKEYVENKGVIIEENGIRLALWENMTFEGQEGFWRFFDDIYNESIRSKEPNICITNCDEALYDKWLDVYEPVHNKRMSDLELADKAKVFLRNNDTHVTSTRYCEYRWSPEGTFAEVSMYIYGDKTAYIDFQDDNVMVTVIHSPSVTDSNRKLFQTVWDSAGVYK